MKILTGGTPRVAIIVVTCGRDREVQQLLDAVLKQHPVRGDVEISVVDNGGGSQTARDRYESLIDAWASSDKNLGASAGRNLAVSKTTAPLLVFLDDDGIPEHNFVNNMIRVFEADPDIIAARGRVKYLHHPLLTSAAPHYNGGEKMADCVLDIEGATCIRREAYEAVGGYLAGLFGHEGVELTYRLLQRFPGKRIVYVPDAILRHDLYKGLRHLASKAKRVARAESGRHPAASHVAIAQEHLQSRTLPDGRTFVQKLCGEMVDTLFRSLKRLYKNR